MRNLYRSLSACAVLVASLGHGVSQAQQPVPEASGAAASFAINGFELTGENPLRSEDSARVLAAFIGPNATLATLQQASAALEAELNLASRLVRRAAGELGGQRDFLAPGRHYPPDAFLTLTVTVGVSGVNVGDAQVNRVVERGNGLVLVLIHQKPAAGAKSEDRHLEPRAAKRTLG